MEQISFHKQSLLGFSALKYAVPVPDPLTPKRHTGLFAKLSPHLSDLGSNATLSEKVTILAIGTSPLS
jgi:hypothetical protein